MTSPSPNEQGSHFWHMSFLVRNGLGLAIEERSGHWTPPAGMTRFDAFNELRRQIVERTPELANAAVIAQDMQPNTIETQ